MAPAPAGGVTERLEATVRGSVQGVGFRWFVQRAAQRLALAGWTANAEDGSVRVVAEGPADKLDELMAALHQGPSGAKVTRVERR
jgi:acylphosphatase